MFYPCPHCQFLVARDPHTGATPAACPRCGKPLLAAGEAASPAPSLATLLHAAPGDSTVQAPDAEQTPGADTVGHATAEVPSAASGAPASATPVDAPSPPADAASDAVPHDDASQRRDATTPDALPPSATTPPPAAEARITAPVATRKTATPRFLHRTRTMPVHARRTRALWAIVVALSLLLCLQVKEVALGAVLVLCFSIGLALTLVSVGAAAAIGSRQASNRWPWLGTLARRAPYFSSLLIIGVGIYVGLHGWMGLSAQLG